jgi:hypothetical protein
VYPNWRVPERRVRKFFKRQSKEASSVAASSVYDDDEETSVNSVPKRVRNFAGRLFGGRRKNENNTDHQAASRQIPPILEIGEDTTINPLISPLGFAPISEGDQLLDAARFPEPEPESEPEPKTEPHVVGEESTIAGKSVANDTLYKDDNDGKKERGLCAPCEGCVVT